MSSELNLPEEDGQQTPAAQPPARRANSADALPTATELNANRAAHWHQNETPLLTIEALRAWLGQSGLVAYGPRAQQLGAPAPSLVEATLGKKLSGEVDLSGAEAARTLLARLVADGAAVPLNLLGAAGGLGTDVPDFVASAAVFSYVFTLRGNKAWKQPPATSGAVKVSPLALAVYEMLAAKVMLSAYDLATQLGKEVTENAVLRALTELWGQLRVIPVTQVDGSATLWELTTARFTKQIKAGANAGQPSALSALISLYLGQALAATEDEIETFLSPLAARSRVRDVIHALLGARQLETVAVEGRTLLHLAGQAPAFATVSKAPAEEAAGENEGDGSRIRKFAAKPGSKLGTGLKARPAFGAKPAYGKKPGFGAKPPFGSKPFGAKPSFGDRERRPFKRDDKPGFGKPRFDKPQFDKPRFDKPWSEDRPPRPAAESFAARVEGAGEAAPKREYKPRPRPEGDGPRRTFSKPGTFGRKREGFGGKPSFGQSEGRPPRRDFGAGESRPPRREFGSGDSRPPRRDASDRPAFKRTGEAGTRSSAGSYSARPKPAFGGKPAFGEKPRFGAKPSGGKPFREKPAFSKDAGAGGEAPRKVYRKFDAPRERKPFGDKPAGGKSFGAKPTFGAKPAFGAKKPFGKSSGGFSKPGSGFAKKGGPFAKFADGKKPFRKPGPGKAGPGKAGPAKPGGGFKPTRRKRPDSEGRAGDE